MPDYKMKPYEDLDITDNFMFCKVFSNVDVAKDFLQTVLKVDIEKISVVAEATSQEDPFHKSVRFDVQVREEIAESSGTAKNGTTKVGRQFDIELQMENTGELPKRARYYQSMCDLDALAKGADYEELQEQYILFICPNDIFHKGKPIYKFQNREETSPEILLDDLCFKFFYIFKKYSQMKDEATREYMQYFATKKCESEKMKHIHKLVEMYRMDPATRKAYMTLEQELNIRYKHGFKEGREEGRAEGRAEGREEGRAEGREEGRAEGREEGRAEGREEGRAEGREEGHAEGREEGRAEGREEGRAEGREEGRTEANKELAKGFRDAGISLEVIAKQTGLTPEEIKAL